jgi:anthranilate phosphoribosyltransferase
VKQTLEHLLDGQDLGQEQAFDLMLALANGNLPPALAGALLAALRAKGEHADEIRGFALAMRTLALDPGLDSAVPCVDVVGTGGDGSGSINLSTGSALLAAAAGARVVKHGNRSISSKCGSADVLEALGLGLPLNERGAAECLERCGFTFLFAPYYHPAMKAIAPVRAALGVRTVFNILGPLVNPASPEYHVLGAYSPQVASLMAQTLAGMPVRRAFVIHGEPGWDEATPVGKFLLYDVRPGHVEEHEKDPRDHGIPRCRPSDLKGGDAAENADALRQVLGQGALGPRRDALVLGAALALEVSGLVADLDSGIESAAAAIDDGRSAAVLNALAASSGARGG